MASNPSSILQANRLAWQDETVDDDFVRKSLVQLRRAQLRAATDLLVSKFIQYDVLNPPDNAVDASKFVQYVVAIPPDNAVDASKFVQYAVIETIPAIRPPPYAFWLRNREAWQNDTDAEEQANSQRLLTSRRIPTLTRVDDTITLSGRAANPSTGSTSIEVDKTVTGVSGTAGVGTETIQMSRPLVGQSATSHSGTETPSIGTPLTGVEAVSDVGMARPKVDADQPLNGVEAVADVGDFIVEGSQLLTGQQTDSGIGDPAIEIDVELAGSSVTADVGILASAVNRDVSVTGVSATTHCGIIDFSRFISLNGLEATASPGRPRSFIQKTLGIPPTLFDPYRGVVATAAAGTFGFSGDRVLNGVQITASAGRIRVLGSLDGVQASTGIQRLGWSDTFPITGVKGTISITNPLVFVGPNGTLVNFPSVQASARTGTVTLSKSVRLSGVSASASPGTLTTLIEQSGFRMSFLEAATVPVVNHNADISVRWSDTRGASWNTPLLRSLGDTGEYATSIQILNMGQARDRIYEISWSAPDATALSGIWLRYDDSGT